MWEKIKNWLSKKEPSRDVDTFVVKTDVHGFGVGVRVYTDNKGDDCYLNKELLGMHCSHTADWGIQCNHQ